MTLMSTIESTFCRKYPATQKQQYEWVTLAILVAAGTFLRFWGLGNVGLHGDEETMAMPALAILNEGGPYFPGGMYYGRALAQLYLMAGSVWMFGESEWALRLPSAVVGSLMPLLAYFLGKRFLSPGYNLVFVATVAFLPAMIVYSQTARMYVFFMAASMLYGSLVFRWEQNNSFSSLLAAAVAWLVALHFHVLAILLAPLFLFPGLIKQSWRNLVQGGVAIVLGVIAFKVYGEWIGSHYPDTVDRSVADVAIVAAVEPTWLQSFWGQFPWLVIVGVVVGALTVLFCGFKAIQRQWLAATSIFLVGFGVVACAGLHYHVGLTAMLIGAIVWLRSTKLSRTSLYGVFFVVAVLAAVQAVALYQTGDYPGRQIIGAFVGAPSIWPMLRFGEFSLAACALYVVVIAYCFRELISGRRIPDHMLVFLLTVWAPLVAIGLKTWYLPPRYTVASLPFFLLSCVAGLEYLIRKWGVHEKIATRQGFAAIAGSALLVVLIVNPVKLAEVTNSGYEQHPDHKGAAEFLMGLPINKDDIVIAEDVLQQVYYLGDKVDYWLRSMDNARSYLVSTDDLPVDQYTAVPHIGTGDELLNFLDNNRDKRIFIIGSGEILPGREEWARGLGVGDVLNSGRLKVIHEGRDGISKVWSNST